jgi:hypothetical protein
MNDLAKAAEEARKQARLARERAASARARAEELKQQSILGASSEHSSEDASADGARERESRE